MREVESTRMSGKAATAYDSVTRLPRIFAKAIDRGFVYGAVRALGWIAYDTRYLKGKWFEKPWSPGWRWAWNGMLAKLVLGAGRGIPWPVSPYGSYSRNVDFDLDDLNNFQSPGYYQTLGDARIRLGKGVWIAYGCSFITSNHNPQNPDEHLPAQSIEIGDHCWIGANVTILPGVVLGPHTTVGANAVVSKSFPEGHCVLVGVPATVQRRLCRDTT